MADTFKFGLAGIGNNVQLGKRGPRIKVNSGAVDLRNAADGAYVKLRIADGVDSNDAVTKSQLTNAINGLAAGLEYKGVFDASAGNYNAITNASQGDFYKISVAGTVGSVSYDIGDMIIVNKDVTGVPTAADVDKIDNTEAADILRTGDISSNIDFTQDPSKLATRDTIKTFVDNEIATAISSTGAARVATLTSASSSTVNLGSTIPPSGIVKRAYVNVTQVFNGATESTVELGYSGDTDAIAKTSEIDLHALGHYEMACHVKNVTATQYLATFVKDGATQGQAEIVIEFVPAS